jgi:hypothetical protein
MLFGAAVKNPKILVSTIYFAQTCFKQRASIIQDRIQDERTENIVPITILKPVRLIFMSNPAP